MEILAVCQRSGEAIDEILRQAGPLALRSARLAEMLRSSWPSSPLYACLLERRGQAELAVVDEGGEPRPEWAALLRDLFRLDPAAHTPRKPAELVKLPQGLKLSGSVLAVEEILFRKHGWGVLALAVPKNASADRLTAARLLLNVVGGQLAAQLDAEAREQQLEALRKELAAQFLLASTGELAGPLAHEFNNFLNIVLLHVALLGADLPAKLRGELTELHRQGTVMTALVKQFQHYRRRQQLPQQPVDLNEVIRDTARALTGAAADTDQPLFIKLPPSSKIESAGQSHPVPLELVLARHLPPIFGSAADLRRLCTFLLTNAAAAAAPVGGKVTIQTESQNSKHVLRVEDTGPTPSAESLHQLFEPAIAGRPGTNTLELAACETLVRRWQGKIYGDSRPGGGLIIIVELLQFSQDGTRAETRGSGMKAPRFPCVFRGGSPKRVRFGEPPRNTTAAGTQFAHPSLGIGILPLLFTMGTTRYENPPQEALQEGSLHRASHDFSERGVYPRHIFERSAYTSARLHPVLTGAALLAAGLALSGIWNAYRAEGHNGG